MSKVIIHVVIENADNVEDSEIEKIVEGLEEKGYTGYWERTDQTEQTSHGLTWRIVHGLFYRQTKGGGDTPK